MIISYKYKFIFIKTLKTAGTSIEVYLSRFCGEADILTPIYPHVEPHKDRNYKGIYNPIPDIVMDRGRNIKRTIKSLLTRKKFYNHIPARLVKDMVSSQVWNEYFKFCVERNPWDKTLSHYNMLKSRSSGMLSLEQYFQDGQFCLNYPIYTDYKGQLIVDWVIKYEKLKKELEEVFSNLGVPFNGFLGVKAKSEYRKDRRPYQEIFSKEQKKIIERVFEKEICMHGYKF